MRLIPESKLGTTVVTMVAAQGTEHTVHGPMAQALAPWFPNTRTGPLHHAAPAPVYVHQGLSQGLTDDSARLWIKDSPERTRVEALAAMLDAPPPVIQPRAPAYGPVLINLQSASKMRQHPAPKTFASHPWAHPAVFAAGGPGVLRPSNTPEPRLQVDSLESLVYAILAARAVITVDTGVAHLAAALGVPTVVMTNLPAKQFCAALYGPQVTIARGTKPYSWPSPADIERCLP